MMKSESEYQIRTAGSFRDYETTPNLSPIGPRMRVFAKADARFRVMVLKIRGFLEPRRPYFANLRANSTLDRSTRS